MRERTLLTFSDIIENVEINTILILWATYNNVICQIGTNHRLNSFITKITQHIRTIIGRLTSSFNTPVGVVTIIPFCKYSSIVNKYDVRILSFSFSGICPIYVVFSFIRVWFCVIVFFFVVFLLHFMKQWRIYWSMKCVKWILFICLLKTNLQDWLIFLGHQMVTKNTMLNVIWFVYLPRSLICYY